LEVIAEVEDLEKTLARFPGLSRDELRSILVCRGKQLSLELDKPRAAAAPKIVKLWTDGASRGNPGPASVGVVIESNSGERLFEISESIGAHTNNYAEYAAVLAGLEGAVALGAKKAVVHADSELVVKQLSGEYRVRHPELISLYEAVKVVERKLLGGVLYKHVPREENREADRLANLALDKAVDKA
jgi:ribonuclease HI